MNIGDFLKLDEKKPACPNCGERKYVVVLDRGNLLQAVFRCGFSVSQGKINNLCKMSNPKTEDVITSHKCICDFYKVLLPKGCQCGGY